MMERLNFEGYLKLEPKLQVLLDCIKKELPPTNRRECWEYRWYGYDGLAGYKNQLVNLVGWGCKHPNPVMQTSRAYEICYRNLIQSLPFCKDCQTTDCEDSPKYKYEDDVY
jgi:hypothetical protein